MNASDDRRDELRLTLRAQGISRDVGLEMEPWASLGDAFIQAGFPVTEGDVVHCPRLSATVSAESTVAECGLRHGDILVLDDGSFAGSGVPLRRSAEVELVVVSGPSAGLRLGLGGKPVLVGRAEHCDVRLADRSVSSEHFEMRLQAGRVEVRDLTSTNGIAIEGSRLPSKAWIPVPAGGQVEVGRSLIEVEGTAGTRLASSPATEVVAKRPPRKRPRLKPIAAELAAPPEPGHRARLPLVAALVPMIGGVALWLLLDSVTMLIFTALSPMMAFGTWYSDRRASRSNEAGRQARWREDLEELEGMLAANATIEARARREAAPNAGTLVARALRNRPELWERRRGDDDVLRLRIGTADLPSQVEVKIGRGGPRDLRAEAERRLATHATLPALPVTIDLDQAVAGVCGDYDAAAAICSCFVLQTAILHSPVDVVICAAVPVGSRWDWVGWLPHAYGGRSPWGGPLIGRDSRSANTLLSDLLALQTQRHEDRQAQPSARAGHLVRVVLLVDQDVEPRRDVIESICSLSAETNVSVVYLGPAQGDLPGTSRWVLEAASERATLSLTDVTASTTVSDVSVESVSEEVCEQVARALAAVRDGGAASGPGGEIPDSVSLLDVLKLREVTKETIGERWRTASRTLGAPLGIGPEGPVDLDLLKHGPHALVVGTTGSGKSEFLKALVAGLIATHPVEHLNLLLLDFKGGAAFLPFQGVPHVVGLASELDAEAARRALLSLRAETERRQRLFNEVGVPDLVAMRRLNPEATPPYLLVAVDEFGFAEEAAPGFIDGMVAIAKKGRSQGVHLLLANQQLDSSFAQGILKNTNLRVALRVLTDDESDAVVGTKAAARIPEARKGRGFWRQAGSTPSEFQGAYVSGHTRLGAVAPIVVRPLRDGWIDRGGDDGADETVGGSDFDALRQAVIDAHRESGGSIPVQLWQPPLPALLTLGSPDVPAGDENGAISIGVVDDPAARRRDPLKLDLAAVGNVLILGPGGAGRTTALRTIAAALALANGPDSFQIYAIDDGSRQLGSIVALPNCGDVVAVHDRERLELLLRRLVGIADQRGGLLAASGAASLSDLAPAQRPPRMVLLLDGMAQFTESTGVALLPHGELLGRIVSSGRQAGVHVVLTADRRSAVPPALQPHIGLRIILRPSPDELMLSGVRGATDGAASPAGRGIVEDGRACQLAVVGQDPARQAESLKSLSPADPERTSRPPAVVALPQQVERRELPEPDGVRISIGICAPDLRPAYVDLAERHLLVLGALHSGRTTALSTLAAGLLDPEQIETYLLTPRRSALTALSGWTQTAQADAALALVERLVERAQDEVDTPWAVVLVDDAHEFHQPKLQDALDRLTRLGRDGGVRIIAVSDVAGARIGPAWLRGIRGEGHALLLMPQSKDEGALVGADIPLRPSAPWVPGRGWLAVGGAISLVQVAN